MEEKKFDTNSLIGFLLIGAILIWMLYMDQSAPAEVKEVTTEEIEVTPKDDVFEEETDLPIGDSAAAVAAARKLGSFGYSETLASAENKFITVENEVLELTFNTRGGYLSEVRLKEFETFNGVPVYIINDGNATFNLNLTTADGKTLETQDLYFEPTVVEKGEATVVSMKLKVSPDEFLEYEYILYPDEYMLDFNIQSEGLSDVLNSNEPITADWKLKGFRHAKSISYENRYTELIYEYGGGDDDYVTDGEDEEEDISYVAFKQHFFTSILLTDDPFDTGIFAVENLVEDEEVDSLFTKAFASRVPLEFEGGELDYDMNWYYGPSSYQILDSYDKNLDEIMPLGWGIFGWINQYIFIPLFDFLSNYMGYGIAIIVMTILIKIVLSPVQYKQYLSQAKMKVLRPEINELNEKYKDNAMKKQQETMKLYSKAGASPMAGCLPALMQLPVFYALFQFFPSAFQLRQKEFLWAEDLSSYDTIAELPFTIPFYGDHVSLFPILASIAIFIYMMMTTGQSMQNVQQPGMPNMKFLMYLSPIFMLFFFNNYASGLSLYYLTSNLITIGIMLVIKHFVIDEEKIHARIQENKKKPRKQGKFARKMQEIMEQAEQQQKQQKGKK